MQAEGAGLNRTSPSVVWFDPDEEHVPSDMFAGAGGAPAQESLIQPYDVGDLIDLRQKPAGKRTTAGAGELIPQQLDRAVEDAVIVRFHQAILVMIGKLNYARVLDAVQSIGSGAASEPFCADALAKPSACFRRQVGQPTIRRTEVRPICRWQAISDLLTLARCSFRTCVTLSQAATGRPSFLPVRRARPSPAHTRFRRISRSTSAYCSSPQYHREGSLQRNPLIIVAVSKLPQP